MRTIPVAEVQDAPIHSFGRLSTLRADFRNWYESGDTTQAAEFRLGGKEDPERDGSDSQLRDVLCAAAGIPRTAKTDENGNVIRSEKRNKPVFVAYTTAERGQAMAALSLEQRDLATIGESKIVSLVRLSGETVTLGENDDENDDDDEDNDE